MEYLCPFPESSKYPCGRKAVYLVQGTVICDYHALRVAIKVNDQGQIIASPRYNKVAEQAR